MDDAALLEAWRAGDTAAGNRLFHRHADAVIRVFRNKVGDATDDLVQRTFVACLERTDDIEDPDRFRQYLLKVARNQLFRFFRDRTGPRGRIDTMRTSVHELGPSPITMLAVDREREQLLAALRRLPIELQLALELYYWEGLRGPELADVLGIAEGTARSRIRLAKERIRRILDESEGIDADRGGGSDFDAWAASLREAVGGKPR
jgi:RNA polymerase sigma-70 factor (ECF subfamily)